MSDILQVFLVTFGAGANTQDNAPIQNWRRQFFATVVMVSVVVSVFVAAIFVAGFPP